jgi:hypothetical protein
MLQHGMAVHNHFLDLYYHLQYNQPLFLDWKLPKWIFESKELLLKNLLPLHIIREYHTAHDFSKSLVKVVDSGGKIHYPNHAVEAEKLWMNFGSANAAKLMGMDMDLFISPNIKEFATRPEASTLILTAYAALHSNAVMFGGLNSSSFYAKKKKLDKLGLKILKLMEEVKYYSYVIVRKDLSNSQMAVQASHAVAEAMKYDNSHGSIILLGVETEEELLESYGYLKECGVKVFEFREPFYDNSLTAICTESLTNDRRHFLKEFRLLNL